MSATAEIRLDGVPIEKLTEQIEGIRQWDNGHNYPIYVLFKDSIISDSIANVENAIKGNLNDYIHAKFIPKNKTFKTDGNGDTMIVDNPDYINSEGNFRKYRNPMSHLTPKKKKRK